MRRFIRQTGVVLMVMACLGAAGVSCVAEDAADRVSDASVRSDGFDAGRTALAEGRVAAARSHFERVSEASPVAPEARAGRALTRLLLLPESEGATLVLQALGAGSERLPLDIEGAVYGRGGALDLLSSGASEILVERALDAALPWSDTELRAGLDARLGAIDPTVTGDALAPGLRLLDVELGAIERDLQHALDSGFERLELASGTLWLSESIVLRRSELWVALAGVQAVRGAISSALAYRWPMPLSSLVSASGQTPTERAMHLDAGLFVALSSDSDARLAAARRAFASSAGSLRRAVEQGRVDAAAGRDGMIDWLAHDAGQAADLGALLTSVREGVGPDVPVPLGFAATPIFWTGSALWQGELVRSADSPSLFVVEVDAVTGAEQLALDGAHWQAFAIDPMFEPAFDPLEPPDLLARSRLVDASWTDLLAAFQARLAESWNL